MNFRSRFFYLVLIFTCLGLTYGANAQSNLSSTSAEILNRYGCPIMNSPSAPTPCMPVDKIREHVIPNGYKNPFFWEVLNNKNQVVGYFLGTTHRKSAYIEAEDFPNGILQKMYDSNTVFMEAKPNGSSRELDRLWKGLYDGRNNNSPLLKQPLRERVRREWHQFVDLIKELEGRNFPFDSSGDSFRSVIGRNLAPLALNNELFSIATKAGILGNSGLPLDSLFHLILRGDHSIHTNFLETPFEQVSIIQHYQSYEKILEFLQKPGNMFWNMRKLDTEFHTKYLEGDYDYFEEVVAKMDDWQYEALIGKRNDTWYKKLRTAIENNSKPIFVYVGSLHFNGPKSLLKKFRDDGFKIIRKRD